MTTTSPTLPRPRIWVRLRLATWRGRFAWAGGMLAIFLVAAWLLSRMTPSWYQPLDPADQGVIDAATRAQMLLHYELRNTVERVPLGEQRWSITQDELNSYFAIDLAETFSPAPTSSAKAPPVSRPCVTFEPGKVIISARSTRIPGPGKDGGVGSLVFSVGIEKGADGASMGVVKLTGVWLGYLPVPRSIVQSRLRALMPAIVQAVQQAIEMRLGVRDATQWEPVTDQVIQAVGEGRPFPLQYRLDKKNLVIKELRVDEGSFTFVITPPAPVLRPGSSLTTLPPTTRPAAAQ